MLALCARYQLRPVGLPLNCSQEPHSLRRGLAGQRAQQPDRFASVAQETLVHSAPPHAARRRRIKRVENAALGLPAHERQRRQSEQHVSRRAARRPAEQARHQCETRLRVIAHPRDLCLGEGERAYFVAHRGQS